MGAGDEGACANPPGVRAGCSPPIVVNGIPEIMHSHDNHDSPMSTLLVRIVWSKVISRGGCFDGRNQNRDSEPSAKPPRDSDKPTSLEILSFVIGPSCIPDPGEPFVGIWDSWQTAEPGLKIYVSYEIQKNEHLSM